MKYRVPYQISGRGTKSKARVSYVPRPGSKVIDIEAPTHAAAARAMAAAILPSDPRPIRGAGMIRYFVVGE